jgi:hypothetical protein
MRRLGAILAIVVAGLALASCYTSEKLLFSEAQAVRPLAVGAQMATSDGKTDRIAVRLESDGWYAITGAGDDKATRLMFAPLPGVPGRTLMVFITQETVGYIYGLAELKGDKVLLDLPTCGPGPARQAAVAHYGVAPARDEIGASCTFQYPEDVQAALVDYAQRKDVDRDYMTLTAAPDTAR